MIRRELHQSAGDVGRLVIVLACLLSSTVTVSAKERLDTLYGRVSGKYYRSSVNGTRLLAELYRDFGANVKTRRSISPRIDRSDVIVWFPDSYSAPASDVCARLAEWVEEESGRTLIYVGRDFNAEEAYWQTLIDEVIATGATDQARLDELRQKLAFAQAAIDFRRMPEQMAAGEDGLKCSWFTLQPQGADSVSTKVTGPWASVVDGHGPVDIPVSTWMELDEDQESAQYYLNVLNSQVLLQGASTPIVECWEIDTLWGGSSQIYFVNNGAFLLNYGFANDAHRKLAETLVEESLYGRYSGAEVLFIETGPDGANVINIDSPPQQPTPWDWMSTWPLSFIVPHFFIVALIFCFAYYPIFGRPKDKQDRKRLDFGEHVRDLGKLFAETHDDQYMLERIREYQLHVRRESGKSHRDDSE